MSRRGDNDQAAAPHSTFRGDPLAAYDRLPAPLRRALDEAVVDWDPRVIRWHLNKRLKAGEDLPAAITGELDWLRGRQADELIAWAHSWPSRFGRYTPHHNAGATVLSYDEAAHVRQARGPRQYRR